MIESREKIYNIAIAPNGIYVKYSLVLLESLFETNPEKYFRIFVMYNSLTKEEKELLQNFISSKGSITEFIYIDREKYKIFQWKERFSVETYFRLEIQDVLPNDVERVLYLDIDMIVDKDISELYALDFEDAYIAACGFSPRCERGDEFNAGMILFNMQKMRRDISFKTYVELAQKLDGNFYQDQGLLNELFGESGTKYVWKQIYNFTCAFFRKYGREIQREMQDFSIDDVVIFHYPGPGIRPWQAFFEKKEYETLKNNGVLEIFSSQGYIIDDLYMRILEKWWDYASRTPVFSELKMNMLICKNSIMQENLTLLANTKAYRLGRNLLAVPKKFLSLLKR